MINSLGLLNNTSIHTVQLSSGMLLLNFHLISGFSFNIQGTGTVIIGILHGYAKAKTGKTLSQKCLKPMKSEQAKIMHLPDLHKLCT